MAHSPLIRERVFTLARQGSTRAEIVRLTGVPKYTVYRWLRGEIVVHGNAGKTGERAGRWMGDRAKPESVKVRGRVVARQLYVKPKRCEECNEPLIGAWARHHVDGNTYNNKRTNVRIVCQSCHMILDNPQRRSE